LHSFGCHLSAVTGQQLLKLWSCFLLDLLAALASNVPIMDAFSQQCQCMLCAKKFNVSGSQVQVVPPAAGNCCFPTSTGQHRTSTSWHHTSIP